jgi:hypothetical protein
LYIRNIIPADIGILRLEHLALSGWGYADFHTDANFAFGEFSEVRLDEFSEVSHLAHKKSQQEFCKRDARTLKVQREFIAIVVM